MCSRLDAVRAERAKLLKSLSLQHLTAPWRAAAREFLRGQSPLSLGCRSHQVESADLFDRVERERDQQADQTPSS